MVVKTREQLAEELAEMRRHITEVEEERAYQKGLQDIFECIADGVAVTDLEFKLVDINDAGVQLLGYSQKEELIGKDAMDIISDKDHARAAEDMSTTLLNGRSSRMEYCFLRKDGSEIQIELAVAVLKGKFGDPAGFVAVVKDITERKRAEQALKESEGKYKTLFDSALDGVAVIDAESLKIVLANQTAAKLYGFNSVEEAIGVNLLDFIPPNDRERVLEIIARDMFGEDLRQVNEFKTITKDGKEKWISAVGTRIEHQGKLAGLISIRDITEQKQAEEALRESQERYMRLYQGINEAVSLYSLPDLKISHWNKRYEDIHKLLLTKDIESTTISDIASVVEADDWDRIMERFAKTLAGEPVPDVDVYEVRMKDLEGKRRVLEVRPAFYKEKDQVVGIQVAMADITERKQAEQVLRESERKYRTLVENIPQKIFLKDKNSVYLSCNSSYAEDLRTKPEDISGHTDYDFYPKDLAEKYRADDRRIVESGNTERVVERYIQKGQDRVVETFKTPVRDESGKVVGVLGVFHDITERKQAREQLEDSFIDMVETISRAIESRDPYTSGHQRRVAELAYLVGEKMGLDGDRLQGLYVGGLLHDLGKISLPESILSRPGKLSEEEWSLIRSHAKRGYDILQDIRLPWPIAEIALHHHERLDGSGYPHGISGDKLSLEVRILAVCDVVEAMGSHRPYRPARSKQEVMEEIRGSRGTKYDAGIVDVLLQIIKKGEFEFAWNGSNSKNRATKVPVPLRHQ